MEKKTPHCRLSYVKQLIEQGKVTATNSATKTAAAIGIDPDGMITVVMNLTMKDFYKSMTTTLNHAVWQDVYRPQTSYGGIYLKLTVENDVLIVSFKEL